MGVGTFPNAAGVVVVPPFYPTLTLRINNILAVLRLGWPSNAF